MKPNFLGNGTIVCVERTENKVPFQVASVCRGLSLQSDSLEVRVDLNTCALTYKDARTGKVLLSERQDMPREAEKTYMENVVYDPDSRRIEKTADGEKEVMDVLRRDTVGWTWKFRNHFRWSEGEALYGLGCHMEDFLDLRGKTMYLCQHNLKEMVPVLNSTAGYGLLFDAGCGMKFQDGAEGGFHGIGSRQGGGLLFHERIYDGSRRGPVPQVDGTISDDAPVYFRLHSV